MFHALDEVVPAVLAAVKLSVDGLGRLFVTVDVLHQLRSAIIQLIEVLDHYVHVALNRLYTRNS